MGKSQRELDSALVAAGERISEAIVVLRRNRYNRGMQRKVYSVGNFELTPVQVDILETVVATGELPMKDVAQALGVDASTSSRTTAPLVELGLIERRPDARDRRLTIIAPTAAGLAQAEHIRQSRLGLMRLIMARLAPDQVIQLADLLEHYIAALTAEGEAQEMAAGNAPPAHERNSR